MRAQERRSSSMTPRSPVPVVYLRGGLPAVRQESLVEEKGGSYLKLRTATRGENPTGDEARPPRRKRVLRDCREGNGRPWSRSVDSERAGRGSGSRNSRVVGAKPSAGGEGDMRCQDARPARLSAAASKASASRDRRTRHVRKGRPGTWDGVSTLCREIGTTRQGATRAGRASRGRSAQ